MQDCVQKWVFNSRFSPSGGNGQPWQVRHKIISNLEVKFELCIDKIYKQQKSLLDVDGSSSVISLGCFIFSLKTLAAEDSFSLESLSVIPGAGKEVFWDTVVELTFFKTNKLGINYTTKDVLDRHTNRFPFKKDTLSPSLYQSIDEILTKYSHIRLINGQEAICDVIKSYELLEIVRCSNSLFLNDLLHEIKTPKAAYIERQGLPSNQLGLTTLDCFLIYLIKKSKFVRSIFSMYFAPFVAKKIISVPLENSSTFYFIQPEENSPECLIELGQCFQEVWILVNSIGYALQPICNSLIAWSYYSNAQPNLFSTKDIQRIDKANQILVESLNIYLRNLTLGFRIGIPTKQTDRAPRKDLTSIEI